MENENKTLNKSKMNVTTLVGAAMLTAVVVVLQFVSMGLRFSMFSITLTLVPIVVGAALYGWKAGAWLGFVFGAAVLLTGDASPFMMINIPATIGVVLVKGAAAGLCAGLVYRLAARKNDILAAVLAAITAPVVNTGIFLLGCRLFFFDTIAQWGAGAGFDNVFVYMIVGLVGFNFLIELGVNLVLNPAVVAVVKVGKKIVRKK